MGLLLLRTAIGVTALIDGGRYLIAAGRLTPAVSLCGLVAVVCGVLLLVGFLTPIASVVLAAGRIAMAASSIQALGAGFDVRIDVLVLVVIAALVLLGPGGLSLDAYMFGRRRIVIPAYSKQRRSDR